MMVAAGRQVLPFEGDVRDIDTLTAWARGLERIVHCAAVVPVEEVVANLPKAVEANVIGSLNAAIAANSTKSGHITYISTSHVYKKSRDVLAETSPIGPSSLYGQTKYQGEQWVQISATRCTIIRVFSFFSGEQGPSFLLPSLGARMMNCPKGGALNLDSPGAVRDIAHVDKLADICSQIILRNVDGIFNCGLGVGHEIREIAAGLKTALRREDIRIFERQPRSETSEDFLVADISKLESVSFELPQSDLVADLNLFVEEWRTLGHGRG